MAEVMSADQLEARLTAQQVASARARADQVARGYEFARPLLCAGNDLIEWMSNTDRRLMFGLPELDAAIRGVGRGELCYLTGRAHSGKTQLLTNAAWRYPQQHLLFITPDEVDSLVLAKLIALVYGVNAERLEQKIKRGDRKALNLVWGTAEDVFPNLVIVDQGLSFAQMDRCLNEVRDMWGAECDGVFIDYLDLLPGDADYSGTKSKSTRLKRWVKMQHVPTVCVHQPKRGGAGRGRSIGMDDMHQAGETEATFVLGVYRKRDDEWSDVDYRTMHTNTVSVTIDKNKRPPCHVGSWDYHLDPDTGRIRPLRPEDMVMPGVPIPNASTAFAARRARSNVVDLERPL